MIDFYALTSPNVQKIYIMLEEIGLPCREKFVDVWKGDLRSGQSTPTKVAFIKSNRETATEDQKDRLFRRGRYALA